LVKGAARKAGDCAHQTARQRAQRGISASSRSHCAHFRALDPKTVVVPGLAGNAASAPYARASAAMSLSRRAT
jgi:hypothetical protein